jgi:hypothetical protein
MNSNNKTDSFELPFALRFGVKSTLSLRDDFDEFGNPTLAYHYKVTQTIPHTTHPRNRGIPKSDKS